MHYHKYATDAEARAAGDLRRKQTPYYCPLCPGQPGLCSEECFDEHHRVAGMQEHVRVVQAPRRRDNFRSPTASPPPGSPQDPSPVASRTRGASARARHRSGSRGRRLPVSEPPAPPTTPVTPMPESEVEDDPGTPEYDFGPPMSPPLDIVEHQRVPSPEPGPSSRPTTTKRKRSPVASDEPTAEESISPKKRFLRRFTKKAKLNEDGTYKGLSSDDDKDKDKDQDEDED